MKPLRFCSKCHGRGMYAYVVCARCCGSGVEPGYTRHSQRAGAERSAKHAQDEMLVSGASEGTGSDGRVGAPRRPEAQTAAPTEAT